MTTEAKAGASADTATAGKADDNKTGTTTAADTTTKAGETKPGETTSTTTTTDTSKAGEASKAGDTATKAGETTTSKAGEQKTGAPDKYDLKLPEKTTLDKDDVAAIEVIARENNWTNEQAQAAIQAHHDTLLETSARFLEATKADKTYGGDKLAQSQARAKAVIDRVRPADHPRRAAFTALLDKSGYGNHIEILSFLADLGAMTEEDGAVTGEGAARGTRSAEEVLYGGTKK